MAHSDPERSRGEQRDARIRLVACDVDGTLLTSGHALPDPVVEAVGHARARGTLVVPATSRPPGALLPILVRLGLFSDGGGGLFDGGGGLFIASQGALVGSYGRDGRLRVLQQHPMPVALARLVVLRAAAAGLSANWLTGERWLVGAVDEPIRQEARITGCVPEVADLAHQGVGPDKLLLLAPDDHPERISLVEVPDGLVATASTPTHLEVTAAGVDKGAALAWLCARLGIERAEVAAIGDGRNDLGMLGFAGVAIAPANAHPDVLRAVEVVVPGNDEAGAAIALRRLVP